MTWKYTGPTPYQASSQLAPDHRAASPKNQNVSALHMFTIPSCVIEAGTVSDGVIGPATLRRSSLVHCAVRPSPHRFSVAAMVLEAPSTRFFRLRLVRIVIAP